MPFGMLVQLPGFPEVPAVTDALSYRPNGQDVFDHSRRPHEGDTVEAVVADHVDRRRQVRLRVGPPLRANVDTRSYFTSVIN